MILALFLAVAHWGRIHDGYATHLVYLTPYGNVIGDYYAPKPQTGQTPRDVPKFTATCYQGHPVVFATEPEARAYVLACPAWN